MDARLKPKLATRCWWAWNALRSSLRGLFTGKRYIVYGRRDRWNCGDADHQWYHGTEGMSHCYNCRAIEYGYPPLNTPNRLGGE